MFAANEIPPKPRVTFAQKKILVRLEYYPDVLPLSSRYFTVILGVICKYHSSENFINVHSTRYIMQPLLLVSGCRH